MFGYFKNSDGSWGYWGCDERAPDLPPDQVGRLMDMERCIREAMRINCAIKEAAARIAMGDPDWYGSISSASVEDVQRERMERAAIAEAIKALNKKETA